MAANIISAIIAASVALIVALLSHWQWRKQQASALADLYNAKRAETLNALWEKLNNHSVTARTARLSPDKFYEAVQDLNFFLISGSPFFTTSEKELARRYLEAVYALRARVDESRNKAAYEALLSSRSMAEVGEIMGALELGSAAQHLEDSLAKHIQETLTGKRNYIDIEKIELEIRQQVQEGRRMSLLQPAADKNDADTAKGAEPKGEVDVAHSDADLDWI